MAIYLAGQEYTNIYFAGNEFTGLAFDDEQYVQAETDTPGMLTVEATRRSRGARIVITVNDRDGIRAVTSVIMIAGDDTRSDVSSIMSRTNAATTFSGTSNRANNKWRVGRVNVTYIDAKSGASHTLTASWSI